MSISDALNYPFKNNNLLKILPLAIMYAIVLFVVNYGSIEQNIAVACVGAIAALGFGFFLSGYYVSALRRLQAGDENLPETDVSRNIKDGVMVTLAYLVYAIPVIIIFGLAFAFAVGSNPNSGGGMGILLMCGGSVAGIVLGILLSMAAQVGVLRYADDGTSGVLFDFGTNTSYVTNNAGLVFGFILRMIVIGLIAFGVALVLGIILAMIFPQQTSPFFEPSFAFWMMSAIVNIISYTFSIIIGLAQFHLLYRFGLALGIGGKVKAKNDEIYDF